MSRLDAAIEEAARRGGVRGPNYKGEYSVCCPFHPEKPDVKFKMQLNPKDGIYYCFRCEVGGRVNLNWLGRLDRMSRVGPQAPVNLGPPPGFISLASGHRYAAPFAAYFKQRGVLHAATRVGAGGCVGGRYNGRVVVPATDDRFDKWHGFSARLITDEAERPKYLYPAGMDRKHLLWGLNYAQAYDVDEVWLVEGVFDALPLFPAGVAAFGKNVTSEQLATLATLAKPVVVCLDGDAWEEGKALAMRLQMRGVQSAWCRLPPKTDPGKLGWNVRNYVQ